MNSSVTVSIRSLVIALAVAAALLLAYLVGAVQGDPAPAAAAPAAAAGTEVNPGSPTIVMAGSGTATGVPDQLTFAVGINATATDVSTALDSSTRTTNKVLDAVKAQGVDADDVQTTGLNIHANYDYNEYGPPTITGYTVSQNLTVLVKSLPDAGKTISAAAHAGGNAIRLHDVRLQVGDEDALMEKARDAAIAEAQAKAAQYAEASGRELGDVLLVREGGGGRHAQIPLTEASYASADMLRAVPIRAGKAELEVQVSVVWSLE